MVQEPRPPLMRPVGLPPILTAISSWQTTRVTRYAGLQPAGLFPRSAALLQCSGLQMGWERWPGLRIPSIWLLIRLAPCT